MSYFNDPKMNYKREIFICMYIYINWVKGKNNELKKLKSGI